LTGLDPTIGYLHVCQPGRQALVYDLMEPYRPQVDRQVLGFIWSRAFTPGDFVVDPRGVCRLHPELARRLVAETGYHVDIDPQLLTALARGGYGMPSRFGEGQGAYAKRR